jgi:hypothetical protein
MKKDRPILFSGAMVRALQEGRKTQTRRIVSARKRMGYPHEEIKSACLANFTTDYDLTFDWACPWGKPEDRLWVRETFFDVRPYKSAPLFAGVDSDFIYRADYEYREASMSVIGDHPWCPSIHMRREFCRIVLEIVDVRVERVQETTLGDICAEGLAGSIYDFKPVTEGLKAWRRLWASTYGEASWDANPWVWVIEFKRVEEAA